MRIAIILSGQPRFIENEYASASHKLWGYGHDVEFFGHYWNAHSIALTSSWSGLSDLDISHQAGDQIARQYPGITVTSDAPLYFDKFSKDFVGVPLSSVKIEALPQDVINFSNTVSMMKSIHEAILLANARHSQSPFDIYVLSRWDLCIKDLIRPEQINRETISILDQFSHFGDNIFLGDIASINLVDAYPILEKVYEIVTSLNYYSFNDFMFVGENIKYISAVLGRGDFSPLRIHGSVEIIRSPGFSPTSSLISSLRNELSFLKKRYLRLFEGKKYVA